MDQTGIVKMIADTNDTEQQKNVKSGVRTTVVVSQKSYRRLKMIAAARGLGMGLLLSIALDEWAEKAIVGVEVK